MKSPIVIAAMLVAFAIPVKAETNAQPYKGFEGRDIASLSNKDIEDLQTGAGWGLALPAELNGYPGPAHVLELKESLNLSASQAIEMQAIYDAMKAEAMMAGQALIDAERQLDEGFKSGTLTTIKLRNLIAQAETARADLRYIHLSRHLKTVDILSPMQIAKYANLRGYTANPCDAVPDGHDATMWRRHNGCDG